MQQDNDHLENKLRQLENQQLPDLSAMDAHWQQMQGALQPGPRKIPPVKNNVWLWVAGAACLLALIVLILKNVPKENELVDENIKPNAHIIVKTIDTFSTLPDTSTQQLLRTINKANFKQQVVYQQEIKNDSVIATLTEKDTVRNISTLNIEKTKMMLNNFLSSIQKKSNVFTINNLRDTIINAKEGTTIFVPANFFDTKDSVVFEIKEFYRYSDMIANGLTTMSDDKQLITGGMVNLSAKVKGRDVSINPQKEIRVFIPNLTVKDSMQIFDGKQLGNNRGGDTIAENFARSNNINWQISKTRIDSPILKMFIRAIDLKDDKIEYTTMNFGNKTKAVFRMSTKSSYSKDELKLLLQKKYGNYYDKIKVRRIWKRNLLFQNTESVEEEYGDIVVNPFGVGDTALLLPSTIRIYKLTPIDTVYEKIGSVFQGYKDVKWFSPSQAVLQSVGEKYSIAINKLGWLNCDRFYNSNVPKTDVVVDLKDTAFNYVTYLVFEKFKSLMIGGQVGNYAQFSNIPIGSDVKIICIGIKDGKIVASIKQTTTSSQMVRDLHFETVTSTELKSSLKQLDL